MRLAYDIQVLDPTGFFNSRGERVREITIKFPQTAKATVISEVYGIFGQFNVTGIFRHWNRLPGIEIVNQDARPLGMTRIYTSEKIQITEETIKQI